MTYDLRNIWTSTNKVLTTINLFLWAFLKSGMSTPVKVKDRDETKIPLGYNIVLLIVLVTIVSFIIYIYIGGRVTIS
jgi:hypothetical protein